jgi:polysaccharide deacetylase 2 family uncharacterized protein YibQ
LSHTQKEIERPLGQTATRAPRMGGGLPIGTLISALAVIAIVGVSASIALREKPFRTIPDVVVSVPETVVAPAAEVAASAKAPGEVGSTQPADGPKIIQVAPEDKPSPGVVVIRDPSAVGQNLRVAHLPDRALIEEGESGPLPIRSVDGRRPMDVYARPWSGTRGARIAIVIGGLGLSQTGTQEAIGKLPGEVTLGFSSQGNSLGRWMQAARQSGHEIVMQVPLEPFDYPNVDPGRNTLTVAGTPEENLKNLRWALSRTTNYTGVMNYMGARFSSDAAAMQPMLAEIAKRGLLYFDDGSFARSAAPDVALNGGVPFAAGDTTIDSARDRGAILKKLDELERTARARGYAVGTGSAFAETVDAVSSWVAEAKKRGIEIVPISAIVADPERG